MAKKVIFPTTSTSFDFLTLSDQLPVTKCNVSVSLVLGALLCPIPRTFSSNTSAFPGIPQVPLFGPAECQTQVDVLILLS